MRSGKKFVWDEKKRQTNLEKHGVDFADAPYVLDGTVLTAESKICSTEKRFVSIGKYEDCTLVVVHTSLDEEPTRIISMRPASRQERRRYNNEISNRLEASEGGAG